MPPGGQRYYYFKTKEEISQAMFSHRADFYRELRKRWDQNPDPKARLHAFIQMTINNREMLARSTVVDREPVPDPPQELHKEDGSLATKAS